MIMYDSVRYRQTFKHSFLYTRCDQKNNSYLEISGVTYVRFSHFFSVMLVHIYVIYVIYQPFWIVSLFLTDKKVCRVLVYSSIFYYSNKWIRGTALSFV